jgi:hypothetical protein
MDLNEAFGQPSELSDRVEKIIAVTERIKRIDGAIDQITWNKELLEKVPEAIRTLGAAKDALKAELLTI